MPRPTDDSLRKARRTLRSLVSDGPSHLPSLNLVADSIRVELERRGAVAILYVSLDRYGRLEPIFGWHVVADILDAVAANLSGMVGSTLRRLDVVSDFTLTDDAFIVLLSPPRTAPGAEGAIGDEDLAAVTRRVYERLQSLLLQRPRSRRVRPRAPRRRRRRRARRRRSHVRAEPAARPGPGHAGGGRKRRRLRRRAAAHARRLCRARRARAAVRAGGRAGRRQRCSATAARCAARSTRPCGCRTCCWTWRTARRCWRHTVSRPAR